MTLSPSFTATAGRKPSVDRVFDDLPRWIRRLEERGVTEIPTVATRDDWNRWDYAHACNELILLMMEASLDRSNAHRTKYCRG
jgi:hypothetical protein